MSATVRETPSVPRRSRLARACVWIGAAISALLIVATILSPWGPRGMFVDRAGGIRFAPLAGGVLFVRWSDPTMQQVPLNSGLHWMPFEWRPRGWAPSFEDYGSALIIIVPYWLLLILVATPTVILAWRTRRRRPGDCRRCGYDLTGNTSGRCPECGAEIPHAIEKSDHAATSSSGAPDG